MKTDHRFTQSLSFILAVALFFGLATAAQALPTVNLTIANSGTISDGANTVTFTFDQTQPSGSGVLDPFLRLQQQGNNTTEQGYNTSVNTNNDLPFDEKLGIHTHDLLFSTLTADSNGNFNFVLDIGEPVGSVRNPQSLLSLDGLKFFSTNSGGQNGNDTVSGNWDGLSIGFTNTLLWNMDETADNYVLLDANRNGNPGNGVSDMLMSVPASVFAAVGSNDYIILWSRFGLQAGAHAGSTSDGTFEEWAHLKVSDTPCDPNVEVCGPSQIPEPTSLLLMSAGLIGFGFARRRRSA